MAHIEPKMRFGDYEAVAFIAAGGMGEMWGGVKVSLTKGVAIKVLRPDLADDPDAQTRFFREARITAALQHGRIVSVLDYGVHNGFLYIVMERVDGVDLRTFIKRFVKRARLEEFPYALVVHILSEVLEALSYAHARPVGGRAHGVIHRDITPGNVLVSSAGELFVTDFGIARYVADTTALGHIVGSLRYMAPEQADGKATPQSDIFGVGGLGHFLLTGHPPLDINTREDFATAYGHPVPRIERDDIPEPFQEFLARCLAFELEDRFGSADAALDFLDDNPPEKRSKRRKRNTRALREIYLECVGEARSHVTGYLQREDAGASFLLPLYWKRAEDRDARPYSDELVGPRSSTLRVPPPVRWNNPDAALLSQTGYVQPEPSSRDPDASDESASHRSLWDDDFGAADSDSLPEASDPPEGRGSTMVLPQRDRDGMHVPRNRVADTVAIHSTMGQPEGRNALPGAGTESHPLDAAPTVIPAHRDEPAPPGSASTPVGVAMSGPRDAGRRSPWVVVVAALALSVVNLGFLLFGTRTGAHSEPTDELAVASPAPPEEEDHTADEQRLDLGTAAALIPPIAPSTTPAEPEPAESPSPPTALPVSTPVEPTPTPPEREPKPEPKPRVKVLFFLKGASHGEIQIAGRTIAVEMTASLNLRPGHYVMQWRRRGDAHWRSPGKVKIPALDPRKEYYEIRLDDTGHSGHARPMPSKRGAP